MVWLGVIIAGLMLTIGGVVYVRGLKKTIKTEKSGEVKLTDGTGKERQTERILGITEKWDYQSGVIEVKTEDGKIRSFKLEPPKTQIFVPEARKKTEKEILIRDRNNLHWSTAFCAGDGVTVLFDGQGVAGINNYGYRMCGLRE